MTTQAEPIRILIVDDEVAQMKALCDTLREEGYHTIGFTSAKAALAALNKSTFDLLLADLMMPEMDGIELLRAALALDNRLAAIMMTGHGTIDTAVAAMKAGALDYIAKPFRLSVILPVISRALSIRRLRIEKEELEQRVRERTADLEALNKELEAFSHSVSHDLRAPLRGIDGFTRLALNEYGSVMPEDARNLLNKALRSVAQMRKMIDDLLNFSQLGRQAIARQPIKLYSLVRGVLSELEKESGNENVQIKVADLPDCAADPSLLKHALINLLSNAFKFSRHKKKALIEIGFKRDNGAIVYFIRDNGAGFDMQYARKLFGVFQRLHSDDQFEGSGIGLSIVQRIIQRHGGTIWAEAEVDRGATFYFTLPNPSHELVGIERAP